MHSGKTEFSLPPAHVQEDKNMIMLYCLKFNCPKKRAGTKEAKPKKTGQGIHELM